jgi:hypothetical protein
MQAHVAIDYGQHDSVVGPFFGLKKIVLWSLATHMLTNEHEKNFFVMHRKKDLSWEVQFIRKNLTCVRKHKLLHVTKSLPGIISFSCVQLGYLQVVPTSTQ